MTSLAPSIVPLSSNALVPYGQPAPETTVTNANTETNLSQFWPLSAVPKPSLPPPASTLEASEDPTVDESALAPESAPPLPAASGPAETDRSLSTADPALPPGTSPSTAGFSFPAGLQALMRSMSTAESSDWPNPFGPSGGLHRAMTTDLDTLGIGNSMFTSGPTLSRPQFSFLSPMEAAQTTRDMGMRLEEDCAVLSGQQGPASPFGQLLQMMGGVDHRLANLSRSDLMGNLEDGASRTRKDGWDQWWMGKQGSILDNCKLGNSYWEGDNCCATSRTFDNGNSMIQTTSFVWNVPSMRAAPFTPPDMEGPRVTEVD